jgi:hypothetical protein
MQIGSNYCPGTVITSNYWNYFTFWTKTVITVTSKVQLSNDPGRTYTPREWSTLTEDEKAKVRSAREQQRKRKAAALAVIENEQTNQDPNNPVGIGATMTRRQQPGARQG